MELQGKVSHLPYILRILSFTHRRIDWEAIQQFDVDTPLTLWAAFNVTFHYRQLCRPVGGHGDAAIATRCSIVAFIIEPNCITNPPLTYISKLNQSEWWLRSLHCCQSVTRRKTSLRLAAASLINFWFRRKNKSLTNKIIINWGKWQYQVTIFVTLSVNRFTVNCMSSGSANE